MQKTLQVHLVPTKDKSRIRKLKGSEQLQDFGTEVLGHGEYAVCQHLYWTSKKITEENQHEIDENLCLFISSICAIKCIAGKGIGRVKTPGSYYKIVATTNKELWYKLHMDCNGIGCDKCNKIIIPPIPQSFIEYYIKNPVKEVNVEYELSKTRDKWVQVSCDGEVAVHSEYIKLSNGEPTWSPVEEKMYSRKELIETLTYFMLDQRFTLEQHKQMGKDSYYPIQFAAAEKWFNKNY